jgi:hypothetical protein
MKTRTARIGIWTFALVAAVTITSARAQEANPERNAYFGQTHLHTSWSLDAYILGNTVTGPAEAYQYATGTAIKPRWLHGADQNATRLPGCDGPCRIRGYGQTGK